MRMDRRQVDFGSFQVHKRVFSQIVVEALESIEGVSLADHGWECRMATLFQRDDWPGVNVVLDDEDNVSVTVKINIRPGYNISDLSRLVQASVRSAIERMININLKDIHVVVVGLERRQHDLP